MSSVEIVEVINALRKPGTAVLRHSNFIVKLEGHPGIHSPDYLGEYFDPIGRRLKCYYLPEREAKLMVMSESLEVQTQVLDRLIEVENKAVVALPNFTNPAEAARALSFDSNQQRGETVFTENQLR